MPENNTNALTKQYHLQEALQAVRLAGLRAGREQLTLENMDEIGRLCSRAELGITRALSAERFAMKDAWQMTRPEFRLAWFAIVGLEPPADGVQLSASQVLDERLVRMAWVVRVAMAVRDGKPVPAENVEEAQTLAPTLFEAYSAPLAPVKEVAA